MTRLTAKRHGQPRHHHRLQRRARHRQAVEELVVEGSTGWVFDAMDAASADAALDRALGVAPERLVAMRAAARRRIATLTPESAARKVVEVLQQASVHECRRPGPAPARPEAC